MRQKVRVVIMLYLSIVVKAKDKKKSRAKKKKVVGMVEARGSRREEKLVFYRFSYMHAIFLKNPFKKGSTQ